VGFVLPWTVGKSMRLVALAALNRRFAITHFLRTTSSVTRSCSLGYDKLPDLGQLTQDARTYVLHPVPAVRASSNRPPFSACKLPIYRRLLAHGPVGEDGRPYYPGGWQRCLTYDSQLAMPWC